jgi:hypothetical protein
LSEIVAGGDPLTRSCRYDGRTMSEHTERLDDLVRRLASAKEFL